MNFLIKTYSAFFNSFVFDYNEKRFGLEVAIISVFLFSPCAR